ncbi:fasciclin domain-containing protein, partial [bacterium]
MKSDKDIIEVATAPGMTDVTTLVAAIKAADLVDTLKGPGPFTVFAPTNEAFQKLPAGKLE